MHIAYSVLRLYTLDLVHLIKMVKLTGFVLIVPGLFDKNGNAVLLNALDSTSFYVGSYARDARLRLSKGRSITFDDGGHLRWAEAAAMVHHHHRPARRLPQGVLGHPQC